MINEFIPGTETEFSFQVNISGTSKQPSIVRVCLEYGGKIECYNCLRGDDNFYSCILTVPQSSDTVSLSIEIVINGKHIRPYHQLISLVTTQESSISQEVEHQDEINDIISNVKDDLLAQINKEVEIKEQEIKEEKKVVKKFEKPVFVKKDKKPLTVDFSELVDKTKEIIPEQKTETVVKISNTTLNKIPFRLIKEDIIER